MRAWASVVRADATSSRNACMEYSVLRASARDVVASIWSRNCPFLTWSPSSTARRVIWPGMVAEMSTFFWAWILPLALTLAWRFSRPTFAVCTSVGLGPRRDRANPPRATSSTTAIEIQRILRFTE